eukprot:1176905-Prorocentrum_minimum.AAC.6
MPVKKAPHRQRKALAKITFSGTSMKTHPARKLSTILAVGSRCKHPRAVQSTHPRIEHGAQIAHQGPRCATSAPGSEVCNNHTRPEARCATGLRCAIGVPGLRCADKSDVWYCCRMTEELQLKQNEVKEVMLKYEEEKKELENELADSGLEMDKISEKVGRKQYN